LAKNSTAQHSLDWWLHQNMQWNVIQKKQNLAPFSFEVFIKLLQVLIEDRIRHPSFHTVCVLDFQFAHVLSTNDLGFLDLSIIHGGNFSPSAEHVRTTVIRSFLCFPPLHDCLTWLKVEFGSARKKKPVSSILNTFFRSYPIKRVFKDDFHCLARSRSTFLDSPLILYDRTLLHCFYFCSHPSEAEKSPPSTPSSQAICLAFPYKIGLLIGYPLAWVVVNNLHKITLTSLCLTILAFDKEWLLSASFSTKSLFSLTAWTVPLETLNLSVVALMLCPSLLRLILLFFIFFLFFVCTFVANYYFFKIHTPKKLLICYWNPFPIIIKSSMSYFLVESSFLKRLIWGRILVLFSIKVSIDRQDFAKVS
jgi:hypothetical protein